MAAVTTTLVSTIKSIQLSLTQALNKNAAMDFVSDTLEYTLEYKQVTYNYENRMVFLKL